MNQLSSPLNVPDYKNKLINIVIPYNSMYLQNGYSDKWYCALKYYSLSQTQESDDRNPNKRLLVTFTVSVSFPSLSSFCYPLWRRHSNPLELAPSNCWKVTVEHVPQTPQRPTNQVPSMHVLRQVVPSVGLCP